MGGEGGRGKVGWGKRGGQRLIPGEVGGRGGGGGGRGGEVGGRGGGGEVGGVGEVGVGKRWIRASLHLGSARVRLARPLERARRTLRFLPSARESIDLGDGGRMGPAERLELCGGILASVQLGLGGGGGGRRGVRGRGC